MKDYFSKFHIVLLNNKSIIILFLLTLLLRIIYSIYEYQTDIMSTYVDDLAYQEFALNIMKQGPLVLDITNIHFDYIPPGIPLFVAAIWSVFGHNWFIVFVFNSVISSVTVVLIFLIGRNICDKHFALLVGFYAIIYIFYFYYIPKAGKENLLIFFLVLICFLYIKMFKNFKMKYLIFLILSFTLLIHTDERFLAYIFPFILLLFLIDQKSWKEKLVYSGIFCTCILILMIPWTVRNYIVYNRLILITPRTNKIVDKVFRIKSDQSLGNYKINHNPWYLSENQIDSIINGQKFKFNQGSQIPIYQIDAMKRGNLPDSFTKIETIYYAFLELWRPFRFNEGYSTNGYRFEKPWSLKHNLTIGLSYGLLLPFFIIGLILLFINNRKIFYLFFVIIIWHTMIHIFFVPFTRNRYRVPIDSIIIISAIYALYHLIKFILRKINENNLARI